MSSFAEWLAGQRARRVVFIAGFFPLPFLGILSAAAVVMAAYLQGPRGALIDCTLALLLVALLSTVSGTDPVLLVLSAASTWLVWVGLGSMAGRSQSLTLAVQFTVVLTLAAMLVFLLVSADPAAFWRTLLEEVYADLNEQGFVIAADIEDQARLMTGVVFAAVFGGLVLPLLFGIAWGCRVREQDFGSQLRSLQLGYVIGGLAAVAGVLSILQLETHGVLLVFGTAFALQGAAVLAWWAQRLQWPRLWWLGLCLVAIVPAALVLELTLLAAVGFVDNWYGLRRPAELN
ncbi:MAG: hypothetical protein V2J12_13060 [Gammaproteobacteria bacterium]|nr:hypothetical protein [Gammaproteobacteria bacterium]